VKILLYLCQFWYLGLKNERRIYTWLTEKTYAPREAIFGSVHDNRPES
jgi:hypothetical protein